MMDEDSLQRTIADNFKYNATWNAAELAEADRRLDALLERSWKLTEARTVGALTLNGASIVACFTALQIGRSALVVLGIKEPAIATSLSMFVVGAMQAVLALWCEGNHITRLAGRQYRRNSMLRREAATLASPSNNQNSTQLGEILKEKADYPPQDFSYSKLSLLFQNGAGAFWLSGSGYLLWRIVVTQQGW